MRKNRYAEQNEPSFGVGFPVGVIAFLMLAITAYLVALDVQIPPPSTTVYLASDR